MNRTLNACLILVAACGDGQGGLADAGDATPNLLDFESMDSEVQAPTFIVSVPGTFDEFLVSEHSGEVLHLRMEDDHARTLGSFVVPEVFQEGDCGLLSLAFDPQWENNRLLYAGHCSPNLGSRVTRLEWDGATYEEVSASAATVLEVPALVERNATNHSVGNLVFEEGGVMLVPLGDKASDSGQDVTNLAGTIARILPNREPGGEGYSIPDGNAFPAGDGGREEILAFGLRYPYRVAHDASGRLWIADVGAGRAEEIDLLTSPGQNFGWRECEGTCDAPRPEFTPPLLHWSHSDEGHPYLTEDPETEPTTRRVAWVAETPTDGPDLYGGLLRGKVLFGDLCLGWVRAGKADAEGQVVEDRMLGHLPTVVSWAFAADGRGYAVSFGSCDALISQAPAGLWRVVAR